MKDKDKEVDTTRSEDGCSRLQANDKNTTIFDFGSSSSSTYNIHIQHTTYTYRK